jgi:hypothetical protein
VRTIQRKTAECETTFGITVQTSNQLFETDAEIKWDTFALLTALLGIILLAGAEGEKMRGR